MIDNIIIEINKFVCYQNSNIRKEANFEIINNSLDKCLKDNSISEEYVKNCLYCAALIKLFQPFSDGNHRTGLILFGKLLEKNGFIFDYDTALMDMSNHKLNLPTFYSEDDDITSIERFKKYIVFPIPNKISHR